MHFDSYMLSETQTAKTLPLTYPPPYSSKALEDFGKLKKRGFKGFTLAETLITLTIVGVIAAMTVPTLISNYQKHTFVVGLKKAYSQLQNAMKMIPISEGCPAGDYTCSGLYTAGGYYDDSNSNSIKLFAKQFKTTKEIFENNNTDEGCKLLEFGPAYYHAPPCFYTEDGMIIGGCSAGICVDINGLKGPNKSGRDQFYFTINHPFNIIKDTVAPYAYSSNDYNNCTSEAVKNQDWTATFCASRVLKEDAMNY